MEKIYTRKRMNLPKIHGFFQKSNLPDKNRKTKKAITISFICIIALVVVYSSLKANYPIFEAVCMDRAKSIATKISNEQATRVMANYAYDDLCTISKDQNGNITMIKANVIPINEIISDIPIRIQNSLEETNNSKFSIPFGSFTGSKYLAGFGPKVHFQISHVGNVETNLKSEFTAKGINQTLHRIYLEIRCNVVILTPFNTIEEQILNQVLLAEAVIVGKVPESYYNLEGLNEDQMIDIIE